MTLKIAFLAPKGSQEQQRLEKRYNGVSPKKADVLVALGGDGFMLHTLQHYMEHNLERPVYGMNLGSVGFLMNAYHEDQLIERLQKAQVASLHPLAMEAVLASGKRTQALAINEVSLLRLSPQTAKIRLFVNEEPRLQNLFCDGLLLSTPAGSTAYNRSAHGPILPLSARLLSLTPISPQRWHGALLPHDARIRIEILEGQKRPVAVSADARGYGAITQVQIAEDPRTLSLLFDKGHSLEERILTEQFRT